MGYRKIKCEKGHLVHTYLSCDVKSKCGVESDQNECILHQILISNQSGKHVYETLQDSENVLMHVDKAAKKLKDGLSNSARRTDVVKGMGISKVEMFQCGTLGQTLHYTLVCDFRKDCANGADENFCFHGLYQTGYR